MGFHFSTVHGGSRFSDLTRKGRDVSTVRGGLRFLERTRRGPIFFAVTGEVLICRLYPLPSFLSNRVQRVLEFPTKSGGFFDFLIVTERVLIFLLYQEGLD